MKRMRARDLLKFTTEELFEILTGSFIVVFDDGELETNYKETLYSSYAWDFHRLYPNTPLLMKHHLRTIIGDGYFTRSCSDTLINNALWSVYDQNKNMPGMTIDYLAEEFTRVINKIYNHLTQQIEDYVYTLDARGFREVANHPEIYKVTDECEPTDNAIAAAYSKVLKIIKSSDDLKDNQLAVLTRSKLVKENQMLQCICARGYVTEVDSYRFRYPIMRGYYRGIRTAYNSMIESRSCTSALMFAKAALSNSEFFSRKIQLVGQIVERLHPGDCGTTAYTRYYVKPPRIEGGRIVRDGSLKYIVGMNYMDTDGVLKTIDGHESHLVGTSINLRTPIHCAHLDAHGICETCFGKLSETIPANTNLGQACVTWIASKLSQLMLSAKHHTASAEVDYITLDPHERAYLSENDTFDGYRLADALKGKEVIISFSGAEAPSINDINLVEDVHKLALDRVSELTEINISVTGKDKKTVIETVTVMYNRRFANFTYDALAYIKEKGMSIDSYGLYSVDFSDWDWSKTVMSLPSKQITVTDHSKDISKLIEARVSDAMERDKLISPDALAVELHELLSNAFEVNFAPVAVVVYSSMIISAADGDYRLPKPGTKSGMGVLTMTMANRSEAPEMAFQGHSTFLVDPKTYLARNRPDHPFDVLLMPQEVYEKMSQG